MLTIESKFSVGDKVWKADLTTKKMQHPCPDCLGVGRWKATSPAGTEYTFSCPRCSARYNGNHEARLSYTVYAPWIRPLTIGSIRIDTSDKERPVSYMCDETGIGSGTIHDEEKLFFTQEEAFAAAQIRADECNTKTEWVAKQYQETLDVCDYQLVEANERACERVARDRVRLLENLIGEIRDIGSPEVRQLIDGDAS